MILAFAPGTSTTSFDHPPLQQKVYPGTPSDIARAGRTLSAALASPFREISF